MPLKIFDHERLTVYQKAIDFISWLHPILENVPKRNSVYDQLDRASTSIALNIAEGNGKFTPKDRCRFFDIARGSALECASGLDILAAKGIVEEGEIIYGKEILKETVSMIVGLIKSQPGGRICEEVCAYEVCESVKWEKN
mgnify:CR=1 FL=1